MEIISHRGYWLTPNEKNELIAFKRSFDLGFGTETDVRDLNGQIVISHDVPVGRVMSFDEFLTIYNSHGAGRTLAINIKSDGLQDQLKTALKKYNVENYFLFDMSIPDLIKSYQYGLICFARESEYEVVTPSLRELASGIWYDYFKKLTLERDVIANYLENGYRVCLVSPELHGKEYLKYWNEIKETGLSQYRNLIICTDKPEEAKKILN